MANSVSAQHLSQYPLCGMLHDMVSTSPSCMLVSQHTGSSLSEGLPYSVSIKGVRMEPEHIVLDVYVIYRRLLVSANIEGKQRGAYEPCLQRWTVGQVKGEFYDFWQACGRFRFSHEELGARAVQSFKAWHDFVQKWWQLPQNAGKESLDWNLYPWIVPGEKGLGFELKESTHKYGYALSNINLLGSNFCGKCFDNMPTQEIKPMEACTVDPLAYISWSPVPTVTTAPATSTASRKAPAYT